MKHSIFLTALALFTMVCASMPARASDALIHIMGKAYAFQTAAQQKTGAVFVALHNGADHDIQLVAAKSDVAETVEIHSMIMNGDMMEMRRLDDGLAIPAGEASVLKPSGNHIMLIGLHHPLQVGEDFSVTLEFSEGDAVEVPVTVVMPGTKPE